MRSRLGLARGSQSRTHPSGAWPWLRERASFHALRSPRRSMAGDYGAFLAHYMALWSGGILAGTSTAAKGANDIPAFARRSPELEQPLSVLGRQLQGRVRD
jgi:hypothetical protein